MQREFERRIRRIEEARRMAAGQVRYVVLHRSAEDGETVEDVLAELEAWQPMTDDEWLAGCQSEMSRG